MLSHAVTALLFLLSPSVNAHGDVRRPVSRNWWASPEMSGGDPTWPSENAASEPLVLYCPHCMNRNDGYAHCGIGQDIYQSFDFSFPTNVYGDYLAPLPTERYVEGQEILITSVLNAHHLGHFEVRACATPDNLSEECFEANKLRYVRDVSAAPGYTGPPTPPDLNYPERAHVHPRIGPIGVADVYTTTGTNNQMDYIFELPAGLVGSHVVFQWRYVTGNSCNMDGYLDWPTPPPVNGQPWVATNLGTCSNGAKSAMDHEGGPGRPANTPEIFWNCFDATVDSADGSTPPAPIPVPVPAPAPAPNPVPVPAPDPVPAPAPAPAPVPSPDPVPPVGDCTLKDYEGPNCETFTGNSVNIDYLKVGFCTASYEWIGCDPKGAMAEDADLSWWGEERCSTVAKFHWCNGIGVQEPPCAETHECENGGAVVTLTDGTCACDCSATNYEGEVCETAAADACTLKDYEGPNCETFTGNSVNIDYLKVGFCTASYEWDGCDPKGAMAEDGDLLWWKKWRCNKQPGFYWCPGIQ